MDELLEYTLLYDFYGELLTERQKKIYESVVFEDYSLGEVAEENSCSRQAVHDMVRRTKAQLTEYEEKLHLVEKFTANRKAAEHIKRICESGRSNVAEADDTNKKADASGVLMADVLSEIEKEADEILKNI